MTAKTPPNPSLGPLERLRGVLAPLVLIGLALICPSGCGSEDIEPIIIAEVGFLEVGHFAGRAFDPLDDGDDLPLIDGIQGGTWIMPGLRVEGLDRRVEISGELRVDDEAIGWLVPGPLLLDESPDGRLQITELAMPVPDPPDGRPASVAYDDTPATLQLTLRDHADRWAEVTVEVRLAGP